MKLVLATEQGILLKRDVLPEMCRRASERLQLPEAQRALVEQALKDSYQELESELGMYMDSLGPEHLPKNDKP